MNKPSVQLSEGPPALTEPYHKARRSYVLFSALLIAWELIGFDVGEVPLENVKITIKSPQAIPAVLIVLIGYFALRVIQEWFQCDVRRRKDRWAFSDFISANVIAAAGISVYIVQRLFEIQVADAVSKDDFLLLLSWYMAGTCLVVFLRILLVAGAWKEEGFWSGLLALIMLVVAIYLINSTVIHRGIVVTRVLVVGGQFHSS